MAGLWGGGTIVNREDKVGNIQINTAEYGSVVPEVLGTTRISGNVIYYDDFQAHEHADRQHAGKGGGQTYENVWYTYSVAVMFGLCEGPISGIGRVWRNKDIFSYPSSAIELTLADGSQTKPWVYVEQHHPAKALSYEGLAYMAGVVNLERSTALPQFSFEVRGKLLETGDGIDVNPADYVLYVLHKVGLKDARIEGIDAFREYCSAADILISSPPEVNDQPAQKIINDIAELTNAYVFWSNDRFKIVPVSDEPIGGWVPDKTVVYDLTADDFLPQAQGKLVTYQRKDTSQAYNQVTVEFINRANFYERESVSYEDTKSIEKIGLKASPVKTCHYLYTKARAARLAEQLCRQSVYGRNRYTFKLDWAFCRLEPADLVSLTDEALGLSHQVVIVDSVTEERDGTITVTAIERPKGYYAPAVMDVHENDRPAIDFNAPAPPVSDVLFIQPPADLTTGGNEIWMAVNAPKNWGGAHVWVSDSDNSYRYIGTVHGQARAGTLVGSISSTDTEMEIALRHGELVSGTLQDALRGNTVCFVGGEYISYEKAELLPNGHYKLSGLVRGQYGIEAMDHDDGAEFCRLDASLFKYKYRDEDVRKSILVKLTSLNMFGAAEEDISEVNVWEFVIGQPYVPPLKDFTLFTRYHDLGRGIYSYDVVARFERPRFKAFDTVYVNYREYETDRWYYGGNGQNEISISGCEIGKTYEIRLYVKDKYGHNSRGITKSILVEMKAEVPNAPQGFSVIFSDKAYFNWREVTNADVDFYELRTNKAPGDENGLIGRSNNTTFAGMLTSRNGKVFLYAHNPSKGYSAPAELTYNKQQPPKPKPPKLTATLGGFSVQAEPIPTGCGGMTVYINNDTVMKTENNAMPYLCGPGIYDVAIAYFDIFGEGDKSEESRVVVKPTIPKEWIDKEALGLASIENAIKNIEKTFPRLDKIGEELDKRIASGAEKCYESKIGDTLGEVESRITQLSDTVNITIDNKIKGLSTQMTQLEGSIYQKVTRNVDGKINALSSRIQQTETAIYQNVDNKLDGFSSKFTQLSDSISLQVENKLAGKADKANLISQINLCRENITIKGKFIHVTGETLFDNNVIVGNMLRAKSITADKMAVDSLSAITANIGLLRTASSGARTEISNNLIEVYDNNGRLRVRMGVW